jgi:inhibitor of KinA sporulation pathway (predicted exonuclease)
MMGIVVVDVEATCWATARPRNRMEIIEIGAVRLTEHLEVVDEFSCFVRPVVEPTLSEFCTELTSITQHDVDQAPIFSAAFPELMIWIGREPTWLCSWGAYDVGQFQSDCRRHGLPFPDWFESRHINLKTEFAAWRNLRRCGMARALEILGLPLDGTHHRGIDDARNIARIAQQLLVDRPPPT